MSVAPVQPLLDLFMSHLHQKIAVRPEIFAEKSLNADRLPKLLADFCYPHVKVFGNDSYVQLSYNKKNQILTIAEFLRALKPIAEWLVDLRRVTLSVQLRDMNQQHQATSNCKCLRCTAALEHKELTLKLKNLQVISEPGINQRVFVDHFNGRLQDRQLDDKLTLNTKVPELGSTDTAFQYFESQLRQKIDAYVLDHPDSNNPIDEVLKLVRDLTRLKGKTLQLRIGAIQWVDDLRREKFCEVFQTALKYLIAIQYNRKVDVFRRLRREHIYDDHCTMKCIRCKMADDLLSWHKQYECKVDSSKFLPRLIRELEEARKEQKWMLQELRCQQALEGSSSKVPKSLRSNTWDKYIGPHIGICKCPMCDKNEIQQGRSNWHASHVIAAVNDGSTTVENLRPLCTDCNLSMGIRDMKEFAIEHYPEAIVRLRL